MLYAVSGRRCLSEPDPYGHSEPGSTAASKETLLLAWGVSGILHGFILAAAAGCSFHFADHPISPEKAPFRWDISLLAAPSEPTVAEAVEPSSAASAGPGRPEESQGILSSEMQVKSQYDSPAGLGKGVLPPVSRDQTVAQPPKNKSQGPNNHTPPDMVPIAASQVESLPPPDVKHLRDSSAFQVETRVETPPILQRPLSVTRALVTRTTLPDYTWLMDTLRAKLERVKVYPASAKAAHAQGKVLVQIGIQRDGRIVNPLIEESSGYRVLDQAALDALEAASPLVLEHELDGAMVVMLVPLSYQLD